MMNREDYALSNNNIFLSFFVLTENRDSRFEIEFFLFREDLFFLWANNGELIYILNIIQEYDSIKITF